MPCFPGVAGTEGGTPWPGPPSPPSLPTLGSDSQPLADSLGNTLGSDLAHHCSQARSQNWGQKNPEELGGKKGLQVAPVFHQPGCAGSHSLAFNSFQFGFGHFGQICACGGPPQSRGRTHSSAGPGALPWGHPAPQPALNWGQTGTGSYQKA